MKTLLLLLIATNLWAQSFPHGDCTIDLENSIQLNKKQKKMLAKKGYKFSDNGSLKIVDDEETLREYGYRYGQKILILGENTYPDFLQSEEVMIDNYKSNNLTKDLKDFPRCHVISRDYDFNQCPNIAGTYRLKSTNNPDGLGSIGIYNHTAVFGHDYSIEIKQLHCQNLEIITTKKDRYPIVDKIGFKDLQNILRVNNVFFESTPDSYSMGFTSESSLSCGVFMGLPGCGRNPKLVEKITITKDGENLIVQNIFKEDNKVTKETAVLEPIH